jgi:hypothetical protein
MSRWIFTSVPILGLLAGCGFEIVLTGDCAGSVASVVTAETCDAPTCRFEAGEKLSALDRDGCEFDRWSDPSCTTRACEAREGLTALFARRSWRLQVDASGAPDVAVTVGGVPCAVECDRALALGERIVVRGVADAGVRPVFSDDCVPVESGRCEVTGDRHRRVIVTQTAAPPVRLTVQVTGPGSVSVLGRSCTADSTCSFEVEGGRQVSLLAMPQNERVHVSWSQQGCSDLECDVTVSEDLVLPVEFRPRIRIESAGSGLVQLNGATFTPPVEVVVDAGSFVEVVASPSPGFVLADFAGVECQAPRFVEHCRFGADAGAVVSLRFTRFITSVTSAFVGDLTDVVARDGGLLALGHYSGTGDFGLPFSSYEQSYVIRIEGDGGVSRLSSSSVGGRTQNFVEMPDGGLWASVTLESNRPSLPNQILQWGVVDAGLPGPAPNFADADRALVRFDDAAFQPLSASLWDFGIDSATTTTGRGPWTRLPEGGFLSTLSATRPPDGGVRGYSALAVLDDQGSIARLEEVNSAFPIDLAPIGDIVMGVALHDPLQTVGTSCGMQAAGRAPLVYRVDTTGRCGAWSATPDAGGLWLATGPLARQSEQVFFTSHSYRNLPLRGPGTSITTGFGHLHAFSSTPEHLWTETLEPLITPSSSQLPTGVRPLDTFEWNGRILAFFAATGRGVSGFKSSSGLQIQCEPSADEHMVVTLHDKATGRVEWGHCFLQMPDPSTISPFVLSNGGNSGYNESPRFVRAFGGVALTLKPASSVVPASLPIGDLLVRFERNSNYVLVVTPP